MNPVEPASIADAIARAEKDERQRAMRALLRKPVLQPAESDASAFALVRKHADWLKKWLARNTGWSLIVDVELVRLRKSPSDLEDGSRPRSRSAKRSAVHPAPIRTRVSRFGRAGAR